MRDNSPMFQHWGEPAKWRSSPEGTAEGSRAVSAVPSGLDDLDTAQPNVETLGYCRMSLRDRIIINGDLLSQLRGRSWDSLAQASKRSSGPFARCLDLGVNQCKQLVLFRRCK